MFIDIHVHTRRIPGPPRRPDGDTYETPQRLVERYDALGIEKAVLLPSVSPECTHVPQSNQEILELCESFPGRFIPFCNIDPRSITNSPSAPLDRLVNWYKDHGYKGCGEVTANLAFTDPMVFNLFRHLEAADMPVTFHVAPELGRFYGLYDQPGLPLLEQALQAFPKLKFFGHSQPFWAEMGRLRKPGDRYGYPAYPIEQEGAVPQLMRQYPNLYGDLSAGSGCKALTRDPEHAVRFMNEFQDRLFFGTDICSPRTGTPLVDFLIELRDSEKISQSVFNKIARENAIRVLGLE